MEKALMDARIAEIRGLSGRTVVVHRRRPLLRRRAS